MAKRESSQATGLVSIYARFSSREREREGTSMPVQLRSLREYAMRRGFLIARECWEVGTGQISEK